MTGATVLIAFFTAVSVMVATCAYRDAAETNRKTTEAQTRALVAQRHALAVSVLQDYMRLAVDHPELASGYEKHPTTDKLDWFESHAYTSAEAIYNLTRGEAQWDSTVSAIVDLHDGLVTRGRYYCHGLPARIRFRRASCFGRQQV